MNSHALTARGGHLAEVIEGRDPEAFGRRATPRYGSRIVLRGKGPFVGSRVQLALGEAVLNRGLINSPTTFNVETGPRAIFSMAATPDGEEGVIQGRPFPTQTLAWWRNDSEVHTQWPANLAWWNLVYPIAVVENATRALFGGQVRIPRETVKVIPIDPQKRRVFFSAMEAALAAPPTVDRGRLSDGLLTLVLDAMALPSDMVGAAYGRSVGLGHARRLAVVDGLVGLADETDEPVSLLSVCEQLDVSLRTLNACSNAVLGMGAARYLRQRRLNRVFHDLHHGLEPSVTEAAMKHGFWELGRFAASFRAAFGEHPSRTLRRCRA